jgi:hypothetical protein
LMVLFCPNDKEQNRKKIKDDLNIMQFMKFL